MSALELGRAKRAGVMAMARAVAGGAETMDEMVHQVIEKAAPLIEAQVRASIAAEFDVLAGMLTDAMERTTVPIDLAICRDRRAQMATAAQMVRGKVTP